MIVESKRENDLANYCCSTLGEGLQHTRTMHRMYGSAHVVKIGRSEQKKEISDGIRLCHCPEIAPPPYPPLLSVGRW